MEENLGELIIDIMTREYKDKVDEKKDLRDYLKEKTKKELLQLYLLYGYAGDIEYIVEEIVHLEDKKKEEIIDSIMNFLDTQIVSIFNFFNHERQNDIKNIANEEGCFKFSKDGISFDTIKILKQLKFIFCKREENGIVIHMPKFIRDKVNSIVGDLYLDYYNKVIYYSKGIADTYGAIDIENAYDIVKDDFLISFEKYDSIIKFVTLLELEPIYYSFDYKCICSFNLRDEEANELLQHEKDLIVYNRELYGDMSNDTYLVNLKEYREFRNFLQEYYDFDINKDIILRGEIVNDYIGTAQLDEEKAKQNLKGALDRYFEIDDSEKIEIINYIDKIRKRMPIWKQGGKINNEIKLEKVGRNEPCPCGSGKKYKNCHRKIEKK